MTGSAPIEKSFYVEELPQSLIKNDRCCYNKCPSYPRHWPKTYILHKIITNTLSIGGLVTDFIFLIQSLEYNTHFLKKCFDKDKSDEDCALSPVIVKQDALVRFWFTFSMPLLMYLIFTIYLSKKNKDQTSCYWCMWLFGWIVVLAFCFFYKLAMILLALCNIVVTFSLCGKRKVPAEFEKKDENWSRLFVGESILSSWPLWVISLLDLQKWYNMSIYQHLPHYDKLLLIIKVIFTGLGILLDSDKLGAYIAYVKDPKVFVIKCKHWNLDPMRLITLQRRHDLEAECSDCKSGFFPKFGIAANSDKINQVQVLHCAADGCTNYLCLDCGWKYLIAQKEANNLDDTQIYEKLSSELRDIYKRKHRISYVEEDNTKHGYAMMKPLIDQDITDSIDNPEKPCRPSSWKDFCVKTTEHLLVFCLMV